MFGLFKLFNPATADDDSQTEDNSTVSDQNASNSSLMEVDQMALSKSADSVVPSSQDVSSSANNMKSTLPELLVKALPDVDIHTPNVLMIGEQSSGKTRMIISLLFYYLIDHPFFQPEMGILLLKLFKTGNSMITRRPTMV